MIRRLLLIIILTSALLSMANATDDTTTKTYHVDFYPDSIYYHISVLADDSLEGREVGEIGEWKAAQYLTEYFKAHGLHPAGDGSMPNAYLQPFEFTKAIELGKLNRMTVNDADLMIGNEFVPMRQSASIPFTFDEIIDVGYGIRIDTADGAYDDYRDLDVSGKAVLVRRFAPSEEKHPDIPFERYSSLTSKISTALDLDAAAVLFITPANYNDTLPKIAPTRINPKPIPIIHLRREALLRLGLDTLNPILTNIEGEIELLKIRDTGYNVVGSIPGQTDTTIIIGAHYDHIGWGAHNSRYLGDTPQIHNGADDNGSGTAAILELMRHFSLAENHSHHRLLFISFSGEESGILGSSYFARNMTIDSSAVKMMINLDMIGRLKDQEGLVVFGTGSAKEFQPYFDSLVTERFNLITKESGIGASDHTAFYNRHLPVLFFFTGAHADYHKPSDDLEFIDSDGIASVCQLVSSVINDFDDHRGPLEFQKAKSNKSSHTRSEFSVTLGITPDFISEVQGLRVQGVSPEKTGERAGILEGDIIIKIGTIKIGDIYDYMNGLGKFQIGDTTTIVVQRGEETKELQVIFK